MKIDRRLLSRVRNIRLFIAVTVVIAGLVGVLTVAQAYYLSRVVDGVFLAGRALDGVWGWLLALLGVINARALLGWASEVSAARASGNARKSLREPLVEHLLKLGPRYARGERSGELSNVATEGVEALDVYFSQYLPQLFIVGLVPFIITGAVFTSDLLSGVILLVTAPVLPVFMILVGLMADAQTKKQWKSLSYLSAHFLDVLQGLTTLKLFRRSLPQRDTIKSISEQYRKTTMKVLSVAFLSALVLEIGATISTAIIAVEIGLRLLYGQMPFQPALFVLLLAPEYYMPFRSLGARFHSAMNGGAAATRILDILEVPAPAEPADPQPIPALARHPVVFDNVCYSYFEAGDGQGEERPALHGVSLALEPGKKIALVGPTGAGKSTVAQLLLRFIEPSSGLIEVNGTPLSRFSVEEWRRQVAWVPQHPYLFNATVAENIALGRPGAYKDEIEAAARVAHAHDFIEALPKGYDTVIGERGARLSGGQAQRLGIARAFLKDAPLLILDEVTSNLDPRDEALITEATARLMEGRTVLAIAHRLATVTRADTIVVLNEGRVVEVGTHAELSRAGGVYSRMAKAYAGRAFH